MENSDKSDFLQDFADYGVRMKIANPRKDQQYMIRFTTSEFASICPLTTQPDFARLIIDYIPNSWLIESIALRRYLSSFSKQSIFQEDCTVTIGSRLAEVFEPHWLRIGAYWYPRGGIPINVFWQTGEPPKAIWIPNQDTNCHHTQQL